jgi:glucosamine--fructose-6-phosphate aminotransferase (isomerizing)
VAAAIEGFESSLDRVLDLRKELDRFTQNAMDVEVIGRGPSFGGAMMGALCIREMTGIRVAPHSGGSFRHGPLLDVNDSHVAIILAVGRAAELGVRLAHDCVSRGGKVILVETVNRTPSKDLLPVKIEPVPEPWEAITSVLVPQALTLAMIERLGTNYIHTCTTEE